VKPLYRYLLLLLLLNIFIAGAGYLIYLYSGIKLSFIDIPLLSFLFSVIAIITLVIFLKGQTRDPESQTLFSFVSVGLKFLLELILALVWFIFAKKTSLPSVLIFFVLYLTLTLFSLLIIMETLKNKSL
jgi:hypothetical protein